MGILNALAAIEVFPAQQAGKIRVLPGEPEVDVNEFLNGVFERIGCRHCFVLELGQFVEGVEERFLVEQRLVLEIVVNHAFTHAGLGYDVVDRGSVVTASRKQGNRRPQQMIPWIGRIESGLRGTTNGHKKRV